MPHAAPTKIKRVGLVIKKTHPDAQNVALRLGRFLITKGKQVVIARDFQKLAKQIANNGSSKKVKVVENSQLSEHCELLIVIGGDGTFIGAARAMKHKTVPILGINLGTLGFLTEIKRDEAVPVLSHLFSQKKLPVSRRYMLEVILRRGKKIIYKGPVVNDAVVGKGDIARIISVQVFVNGQFVTTVRADGLIVSTPTGSTAYSLAAGGPIVEPTLPALIITPICPHSLNHRPIVLPDRSEVRLMLAEQSANVLLTLDGQDVLSMRPGDVIEIRRSPTQQLELIGSPTRDYFSLLFEKLKFGMRN